MRSASVIIICAFSLLSCCGGGDFDSPESRGVLAYVDGKPVREQEVETLRAIQAWRAAVSPGQPDSAAVTGDPGPTGALIRLIDQTLAANAAARQRLPLAPEAVEDAMAMFRMTPAGASLPDTDSVRRVMEVDLQAEAYWKFLVLDRIRISDLDMEYYVEANPGVLPAGTPEEPIQTLRPLLEPIMRSQQARAAIRAHEEHLRRRSCLQLRDPDLLTSR
jgi:hypothetical protein